MGEVVRCCDHLGGFVDDWFGDEVAELALGLAYAWKKGALEWE